MTDTLKLLSHVQLGRVEVDLIPGQAEDLTPAQAEDEDQDEGRVERFTGMPRGFEEPASVINGPRPFAYGAVSVRDVWSS